MLKRTVLHCRKRTLLICSYIGIPQALQEKAFERFFRIDRRSAGNSGLGLAIVKEICTALGARISLQTPAGGNGLQVDIEFVAIS